MINTNGPRLPLQSALDAAGLDAAQIENLWWIFFWVSVVVYVAVAIALFFALFRGRWTEPHSERAALRGVTIATALTVVTLFGLLISSVTTGRMLAANARDEASITIEVIGRQWWWQVDYDHQDKSKRFTTANELYIPAGETVRVKLLTGDVIHSFWIPNLNGKQDLISGRHGDITLRAERPGVYRGQCAEFCGLQHAKMAFWVNVVPREQFDLWAEGQRKSSKIPSSVSERKGYETFMSSPCPVCHTVRGTLASGETAPDLTHFASRRSIAAATLPNRRGYLAAWIVDPQHLKPGSFMPPMIVEGREVDPLLDYLESLD